jgi:uncharacterized membrane protein HdeD (DUF308 family)
MHRLILAMFATLLLGFVGVLFYLSTNVESEDFEAIVSLVTLLTVETVFVYMGTAEGITAFQFGNKHKCELWSYLILGSISAGSGLYLAISRTASLQTVAVLVSPHAFLLGVAELRIAQHIKHHPKQRRMLLFCGTCELMLGMALLSGAALSTVYIISLFGYAAILTSFQLLAFLFYRRHSVSPKVSLPDH